MLARLRNDLHCVEWDVKLYSTNQTTKLRWRSICYGPVSVCLSVLHTTNRKHHMAYLFVSFPVTLDDLEGHSRDAGLIKR